MVTVTNVPDAVQRCLAVGEPRRCYWHQIRDDRVTQALWDTLDNVISKRTYWKESEMSGESYPNICSDYVITSDEEYRYIGLSSQRDRDVLMANVPQVEVPEYFKDRIFRHI